MQGTTLSNEVENQIKQDLDSILVMSGTEQDNLISIEEGRVIQLLNGKKLKATEPLEVLSCKGCCLYEYPASICKTVPNCTYGKSKEGKAMSIIYQEVKDVSD